MSDEPVKKGRGCFFYGCLTLVVVVVLALLGMFFGTRYVINQAVQRYTEPAPIVLPKVDISAAEAAAVQERFKAFRTAIENGKPAEVLTLTEKELNALIAGSPDFAMLKDKVYLSIDQDQIKGQISFPLDQFPIGKVKGRYLNGTAGFGVSLDNGILLVTLQSLEVKGEPVPDQFMMQMRQQNLAQNAYKEVKTAEILKKLQSIEVRDGRIVVKPRQNP